MENKMRADVKETRPASQRSEIPSRLLDPNKPCDRIRDVRVLNKTQIGVFDERSPLRVDTLPLSPGEELKGFGKDFIVKGRNESSGSTTYQIRDSKNKLLGERSSKIVGNLTRCSDTTMTFENAGYQQVYDRNFNKIGSATRIPK